MKRGIYLSGIQPSGNCEFHLGNYVGSIKPLIEILKTEKNIDVFCFIADYHALTSQPNTKDLNQGIKKMMLSLYSIFENITYSQTNNIFLYRQSDIPSIFEYYWILSCFTAKGMLNRMHSYKQKTTDNIYMNKDKDKGIFAGLYNYPVLMATDIMCLNPDYVTIGKDQKQHVDLTRDIADKINWFYDTKHFKKVEPIILNDILLPGIDGRKMSKSYKNTLSLFASEKELKKFVFKFKTNFKDVGEPKSPQESCISDLYNCFVSSDEYEEFVQCMESGTSWVELKTIVFDYINKEINIFRNACNEIEMNDVNQRFYYDSCVVNRIAMERLSELREIIGMKGDSI